MWGMYWARFSAPELSAASNLDKVPQREMLSRDSFSFFAPHSKT
jgi:hypothetical protein